MSMKVFLKKKMMTNKKLDPELEMSEKGKHFGAEKNPYA
jgi:hypothetical protein